MKIGIYTLPLQANYGGILQAYALQTVLQKLGHEVILLDKNYIDRPNRSEYFKRILNLLLCPLRGKRYTLYQNRLYCASKLVQFIHSQFPRRYCFRNHNELNKLKLDAIVVGSDQIWRKGFCKDVRYYFLNFAKGWSIKRYSYAASFGIEHWQYSKQETIECSELFSMFDKVSVREKDAVMLCEKYLGRKPQHVLDPTFLLDKLEYIKISTPPIEKNYLLSFILDPNDEIDGFVKEEAKKRHLSIIKVSVPEFSETENLCGKIPGIEDWIGLFMNASFVITDSFHGTAFSINFNIDFITLGNADRGQSRFKSLLNLFDLNNRLITDTHHNEMLPDINWDIVNDKLEKNRKDSICFIKQIK